VVAQRIDEAETGAVPSTVRAAAGIVAAEAAALVVTALVLIVLAFVHTSTRLWAALAIVGFALLAAAILLLCARGLMRLRPSARSPVVIVQLLALPVGYSLGIQSGRMAIAGPMLAAALATLVLLATPSARRALDRIL